MNSVGSEAVFMLKYADHLIRFLHVPRMSKGGQTREGKRLLPRSYVLLSQYLSRPGAKYSSDKCRDEKCEHIRKRVEYDGQLCLVEFCRDRKFSCLFGLKDKLTSLADECQTKDCVARKYPDKEYCVERKSPVFCIKIRC